MFFCHLWCFPSDGQTSDSIRALNVGQSGSYQGTIHSCLWQKKIRKLTVAYLYSSRCKNTTVSCDFNDNMTSFVCWISVNLLTPPGNTHIHTELILRQDYVSNLLTTTSQQLQTRHWHTHTLLHTSLYVQYINIHSMYTADYSTEKLQSD